MSPLMNTWVGLLVIKNRKVLMVREHDQDYFMLPGGTCEEGEQPEATLARELQEELGVTKYSASKWNEYYLPGRSEQTIYHFIVYSGEIYENIQLGKDIAESRLLNNLDDVKLGTITRGRLFPELQHRGLID